MPWSSRLVTLSNGSTVFVRERGQGQPLVLCNGFGCAGFVWEKLAPRLTDQYHLIDWNYRGHAFSDAPDSPAQVTIEAFANDLLDLVDRLQLVRPVVLGHSLGVQVALTAALQARERFAAVVAISGVAGELLQSFHGTSLAGAAMPWLRVASTHLGLGRSMQALWGLFARSENVQRVVKRLETDPVRIADHDMTAYFEHLGKMDVKVLTQLGCSAQRHNVEARLPELTVPLLVLAGASDRTVPSERTRRIADLARDARFHLLAAGHLGPLEEPEQTAELITAFLREVALSHLSVAQAG